MAGPRKRRYSRRAQQPGQPPEPGVQVGVRLGDQLDGHVVGAGVEVVFETPPDLSVIAGNDQGIDQAVAALARDVVGGEAEPLQVRRVVRQAQVRLNRRTAERPRADRVRFQDDPLLGSQQLARTENLPGQPGVLGRNQVRMRACRPLRRQPQHPRAERREDPPLDRNILGVEHVEVVHQRLVWRVIRGDGLGMTDPDAEQEAPGMGRLDAVVGPGDLGRVGRPDVDDAGRDLKGAGRVQDRRNVREVAGGEPPCQTVSYPSDSSTRARSAVSTPRVPEDPVTPQLHDWLLPDHASRSVFRGRQARGGASLAGPRFSTLVRS